MFKLFIPKVSVRLRFERSTSFSSQVDVHDILVKHLEFHKEAIDVILKHYWKNVIAIPKKQLILNCKIIQKLPVGDDNAAHLLSCLQMEPIHMKHRIMLLEEMGVKTVHLKQIFQFPGSVRGSVRRFKTVNNIPQETCLMNNIFSSINLEVTPSQLSVEKITKMTDYYEACMDYYKTYHLRLYHTSLLKSYNIKYQSFRQLTKLLNILETKFKFSKKFMSKHPYLLNLCLDDVNYFLDEIVNIKIDDIRIMELIRKNPRILCADVENMKKMLILLKTLGIPDSSIVCYSNILRMNTEVFLYRYEHIISHPEINIWSKHPRILQLVILYKQVVRRIRYLRLKKILYSVNTHTLSSSSKFFIRYVQGLCSHVNMKRNINYLLWKELDLENTDEVIDYLSRHPHWKKIPLLSVSNMLRFLRKHYSVKDICENIHIVLYAQVAVVEMLEEVHKEYTAEKGYNFTDSQYLALCLYKLEQTHHFSGDAVWKTSDDDDPDDCLERSFELDNDELRSLQ